ncbi:MAG: hypothetical protein SGILL_010571 [Bacillariaceae sp.]
MSQSQDRPPANPPAGLPPSFKISNVNTAEKKNTSFASKPSGGKKKTSSSKANQNVTLSSLLKYMEGYEVIVELKTGKRHQGILLHADDNTMNVILKIDQGKDEAAADGQQNPREDDSNVIYQSPEQDPSQLSIRGSTIRYIQFPDNGNLSSIVLSGREREQAAKNKYRKTLRKSTSS